MAALNQERLAANLYHSKAIKRLSLSSQIQAIASLVYIIYFTQHPMRWVFQTICQSNPIFWVAMYLEALFCIILHWLTLDIITQGGEFCQLTSNN